MRNKILITGGAGFIGSHLCEEIAKDSNNDVFSLDNYFTGSEDNHVKNVTYIRGSSSDIESLVDFSPDIIYHLGEYSRVEQSFDDIKKVWSFNKTGIFAVLEFARKSQAKLVYSGSSTKFGDNGLGRNQSPYAWTKASNTELVVNYGKWFDLKYAIVYFYNVYGEREISNGRYATLIAKFREQMKHKKSLTVVKPGTQKRNFTHILDIVSGLVLVGEKGFGDDFGIGCSKSYTVLEIAQMFNGEIEMLPERKGNRMTADVIVEKTQALGWRSKQNITDYIHELNKNNWLEF
ncbi:NAD-dependent epimerase/dehydratase family protein [Candidatus Thioglobus sp.]|nr:NAD-dependent epimerase/dehydratase family protein [Candidatus Thioglobus sp.]